MKKTEALLAWLENAIEETKGELVVDGERLSVKIEGGWGRDGHSCVIAYNEDGEDVVRFHLGEDECDEEDD